MQLMVVLCVILEDSFLVVSVLHWM